MEVTNVSSSVGNQNGFAAVDSNEFIQILITELQNQDPFDPQDSGALLEQLSSLRNIESQTTLTDQLRDLVGQNEVAVAGNLIGKIVAGIDTLNSQTSGIVTSVRVSDDGVLLELDNGRAIEMSQLIGITEAEANSAEGLNEG
jgi:flagellar basal-body rod modification protein FlgD